MTELRRRVSFVFLWTSILLGFSSQLTHLAAAWTGPDAVGWRTTLRSWVLRQVSLCSGRCTCSYADRIVNGQPYTDGAHGFRLCSTACGPDRCHFRPGVDGCGAILYLGCTDLDCRPGTSPALTPVPVPTRVVIPPVASPVPEPTVPVPTPGPDCTPPQEWVELQRPHIARVFHVPPYPVLQSQVTARETVPAVTFSVEVQGGQARLKTRGQETVCPDGGRYPDDCPNSGIQRCRTRTQATYPDPVVHVQTALQLTGQSQNWISGYLASRYPRAHVRQPTSRLDWAGSTMSGLIALPTWDPRDPGRYVAQVTATTSGTPISAPQTVSHVHLVDVSLLDTTLVP